MSEELADALGHAGSIAHPVVDAVALEFERGGRGAGVVGADDLDGAAVAGAIFFDNNDALVGLLASANARQTNHQHLEYLSEKQCMWAKRMTSSTPP